MGKGEKRLTIEGLIPGEKYAIQVRAVDDGAGSVWSQKYNIDTIDDSVGGTRTPAPPALREWKTDAAGQYIAIWDNIKVNTDGTPAVIKMYELGLTAGGGEVVIPHYGLVTDEQMRTLNFGHLRSLFGGQVPTSISARLRMVNSAGSVSEWSEPKVASLPVPNPPKNVKGVPAIDAIKVTWEPPDDPIYLVGYRVYMSMTDAAFVPNNTNIVYQGASTEFTYTSLSYDLDHWFKVVSYSEPGLESTWVEPVPTPNKPISPYGPDDVPPEKPVLGTPSMDRTALDAPKANLMWTIDEAHANNQDISGFVIRWKAANGTDGWRNAYFDKAARGGVIDLPQPFANYTFEIAAYDFVANYSDYAGTAVSLAGATAPPTAPTGVSGVPRWDGIRIVWDKSNESVQYGGVYEVQLKTTNSFPNNTPDYTTANTFVDVTGLTSLTTYYYRVRAIDAAGQASPWSGVVNATLPAFPVANATDGVAPSTAPQNVRATGGLNYVNIAWDRVTNSDEVWYEVFMSTTANFSTYNSTTFVGESSGTSLMVASLPNGSPLQQETNYYFKVRAVDADNPGPISSQVTSTLTQVLSTDLGINMGGENLLINSSLDVDSDGNGIADYWAVYNDTPQTNPTTNTLVTGRVDGKAQRVAWTGVNTGVKGVYPAFTQANITKPNTEYVVSFYARANSGTGFGLRFVIPPVGGVATVVENPGISSSFNRYIYKFTTGATVDANNFYITVESNSSNGGWVEIDDVQLEAGNVASAYKPGTVSIAKLISGRMSTAEMIIDRNGIIKSDDYNATTKVGWAIHNGGIDAFKGQISAATLIANTTITSNLYVNSKLEMSTAGIIQSANYNPGVAGYRLSSVSLDIRTGTVGAGTLVAGTISSPDIRVGSGGKITIDANGSIVSNNYNGPSDAGTNTGFKISNLGIEMWDTNSKINVNALETSTMTSRSITIGSGGTIQSMNWAAGTGARWLLAENEFTMHNGTITGSTIKTNQIYSLNSEVVGGVTRYRFSIDADGYAEFVGARVYGNMSVGSSSAHAIQSGTYNGSTGWKIFGDGTANFFNMNTWNANIYGGAIVGVNNADGVNHYLKSANFAYSSAGWLIRGDGYAEFNGGDLRMGSSSGSIVRIAASGSTGRISFHLPGTVPGDGYGFNYIQAPDWNLFEMRGAHGGAIELWNKAAWDGQNNLVRLAQDAQVTQDLTVDNKSWLNGEVNFGSVSGPVGAMTAVGINGNGYFKKMTSSLRYKTDVVPMDIDVRKALQLEPKFFMYKTDKEAGYDIVTPGFIAEEAADLGLDRWVSNAEIDGEEVPDAFSYQNWTATLQHICRSQQEEIDTLKSQVEKLLRALDK